jgi:hypothetical protein
MDRSFPPKIRFNALSQQQLQFCSPALETHHDCKTLVTHGIGGRFRFVSFKFIALLNSHADAALGMQAAAENLDSISLATRAITPFMSALLGIPFDLARELYARKGYPLSSTCAFLDWL